MKNIIFLKFLFNVFIKVRYRFNGKCRFSFKTILNSKTFLENSVRLGPGHFENSSIGFGTYVASGILSNCTVGRFCSIGHNFSYVGVTHPTDFVSTYPGFYDSLSKPLFSTHSNKKFKEYLLTKNSKAIEIGNDVWIGNNVVCKGGITIGDGAIIGYGSNVTKDVPPYSIVAGNPAKIIRYRFNQDIINTLLLKRWWEWPLEKIKNNRDSFLNINDFIEL